MFNVIYLGPPNLREYVSSALGTNYKVYLALEEESVRSYLAEAHVIIDAYMRVRFSKDLLDKALNLRLVVAGTTGFDHIDVKALQSKGIPFYSLRDQKKLLRNLTPAAELSWLLLMASARNVRNAIDEVLEGTWNRNNHPGLMLKDKILGIIGCGRIGQWMARYGSAFGMRCIGFDPKIHPWPDGIEKYDLDELLRIADFVSIHVPLNNETRNLIGEKEFSLMKQGVIVVNTSRGEVLDESVLLASLCSGKVRAAGLDVLSGEPEIENHPLLHYARSHKNLIITPHIGGFSPDAVKRVLSFCCQTIKKTIEK